jgi:tetratricopeptide (TPR) repeat protein
METTRKIEQYLEGTLGKEERREFEERARQDKDFQALIRMHREVDESIRDEDLALLRDKINRMGKEYVDASDTAPPVQVKKQFRASYRIVFRAAAGLVLFVAAGLALKLLLFSDLSPEGLFQKYYTPYNSDVVFRSSAPDGTNIDKAIRNYSMGNYAEALILLEEIIRKDPANNLALFYRGLAALGTDDGMTAIRSLQAIPDYWNSPFIEHRNWYLALALLQERRVSEAAKLFNEIDSGGGYYAEKARKISRKL